MELIAVLVGYILGALPFILPDLLNLGKNKKEAKEQAKEYKSQEEILDEWLNGPKREESSKVNQEDLFKEYMTGEISAKGD